MSRFLRNKKKIDQYKALGFAQLLGQKKKRENYRLWPRENKQ